MDKKKINNTFVWGKILILALLVVVSVRFFLLESFYISSSAMETAVLNGDYLIVSKNPMGYTPERNAVVLFASPLLKDSAEQKLFLSRCIGLPGDTLELKDNGLSINGKEVPKSPHTLACYMLTDSTEKVIFRQMKRFHIPVREPERMGDTTRITLTPFEEYQLREELPQPFNDRFIPIKTENYKLIIPRKGIAYRLDAATLTACKEIILAETNGKAIFRDGKLFLDGRETSFFFFRQNYYWMLSDNTMEGIDSRHLGLIPESHITGCARFVWMSKEPATNFFNGYRWNRLFKTVN